MTMQLKVRLFAAARAIVDVDEIAIDLPESATIADVRAAISKAHPQLESILQNSRLAMNQDYVAEDAAVEANAELAVIPPVSGG